jgi:hypothetical protein
MATFQQNLSASHRGGSSSSLESRGIPAPDRRPYLVTPPRRKPVASATQSVATTRQFFALYPHEAEDARITGATRSLYRRLLALNLPCTDEAVLTREITEIRFNVIGSRSA